MTTSAHGTDAAKKGRGSTPPGRRSAAPVLRSHHGGQSAEVADAMSKIAQEGKAERLEGAKRLQELKPPESFEALLSAAEKEADAEVKCGLLEALSSTAGMGSVAKPKATLERLEALLFSETDARNIERICNVIYYSVPGNKHDAEVHFRALRGRAEARLGRDHAVSQGVSGFMGYATAADLF
jgi:hypothetical protein